VLQDTGIHNNLLFINTRYIDVLLEKVEEEEEEEEEEARKKVYRSKSRDESKR